MKRFFFFICALIAFGDGAQAGPPEHFPEIANCNGIAFALNVDGTRKCKDGDRVEAYDVVQVLDHKRLVKGDCAKWETSLKGVTWCFSSEKNLSAFRKATDKDGDNRYIPALGGRCLLATGGGNPYVIGDPRAAIVVKEPRTGEEVIGLQGGNQGWPTFLKDPEGNFKDAMRFYTVYRTLGVIVPNGNLPRPTQ